jgi:hypothetical protein
MYSYTFEPVFVPLFPPLAPMWRRANPRIVVANPPPPPLLPPPDVAMGCGCALPGCCRQRRGLLVPLRGGSAREGSSIVLGMVRLPGTTALGLPGVRRRERRRAWGSVA